MVRGREWTGFEAVTLQEAMRKSIREFAALLGVESTTINNWRSKLSAAKLRSTTQAILDTTFEQRTTAAERTRFDQLIAEGETVWRARHKAPARRDESGTVATASTADVGDGDLPVADGEVPARMADELRSTAATYRAAYRMAPARQLLAAAHCHMQLALSLRPGDQPDRVRDNLLTTAGEMAALAGIILGLDLGEWRNCAPYFQVAERSARECGNSELHAVVMACHAFQAAYGTEDLQLGLDYAQAAGSIAARGASPVTRGWVAAVTSERHADLGDGKASLHLLDEARTALEAGPVESTRYSGIGAFDAAKLTAYEGGNHRRLGNFNKAVVILDTALTELGPSLRRHRATALIDRAEAKRDARRIDAACADTREALVLVAATQHAGTLDRAMRIARSVRDTGAREAITLWNDVLAAKAAATTPK